MITNLANNQVVVNLENQRFLSSYGKSIVRIDEIGNVFLDEKYWNYSKTTSKYRSQFLNESTKETKAKIESGEYQLINLNQS